MTGGEAEAQGHKACRPTPFPGSGCPFGTPAWGMQVSPETRFVQGGLSKREYLFYPGHLRRATHGLMPPAPPRPACVTMGPDCLGCHPDKGDRMYGN